MRVSRVATPEAGAVLAAPDPYDGCVSAEDYREADIMDATALVIQAQAELLAACKRDGGANPALYRLAEVQLPLLLKARYRLGASWADNELEGYVTQADQTAFLRFLRRLLTGPWTEASAQAALHELAPLWAKGGTP